MKTKIIGALLALISGGTAFAGSQHLAALPPGVELGVYDVVGSFRKLPTITYEHIWYRWDRPIKLSAQLHVVTARGRNPLLTVEPYGPGNLFGDIAAGRYDSLITDIAQQINQRKNPEKCIRVAQLFGRGALGELIELGERGGGSDLFEGA